MEQNSIELTNVTKSYRDAGKPAIRALQNVSLRIRRGEVFCLVGPSGCGKTTVLNLVAGFVDADSGAVLIEGETVHGPHSRCGVVFQQDAVFPWMTVADNVRYGLHSKRLSDQEQGRLVNEALGAVGLLPFADRWPRELSGGMRKRVDLARAYARGPSVMLLDEPFGFLDVLTKEEMQELVLQTWRSKPTTILFVTHDVEEAVFLGQRVAVMSPAPGAITQEFEIPFAVDERVPDLKLTPRFVELRRAVQGALMKAKSAE